MVLLVSVIKELHLKWFIKLTYYIAIGQWTEQMKEVIQQLHAHYGTTNIDEYVVTADQHAMQTTKKSHDTPERPPPSDPIPNDIPVSLDVDTSSGGEPPLNHRKQPSPDPDATIDYISEHQFLVTTYFSNKAFTSEKEGEEDKEDMYTRILHSVCFKKSSKEVT